MKQTARLESLEAENRQLKEGLSIMAKAIIDLNSRILGKSLGRLVTDEDMERAAKEDPSVKSAWECWKKNRP